MKPIEDATLSAIPLAQLYAISPSRDERIAYYPCRAHLSDGTVREFVYVADVDAYAGIWGDVGGRSMILASTVVALEESPQRLPPQFANQLYKAGESGMGYSIFTLQFRDGSTHAYVSGNAVDFLPYPANQTPSTVVAVHPHVGRDAPQLNALQYDWCLVRDLHTAL